MFILKIAEINIFLKINKSNKNEVLTTKEDLHIKGKKLEVNLG